jgi:hypothetical protein
MYQEILRMQVSQNKKTAVSTAKKTNENIPTAKYTVSEGSTVIFDLREFVSEDNLKSYFFRSCTQTSGIPVTDLKEEPQTISFKAPYLKDHTPHMGLEFKLQTAAKDKNDNVATQRVNVIVKRVQRAVIFQGGVALGVYEAGVFHALVKKLSKQDQDESGEGFERQKRPLFDIVAGTSIGGMNAAVVLGSIRKGDSWEDAGTARCCAYTGTPTSDSKGNLIEIETRIGLNEENCFPFIFTEFPETWFCYYNYVWIIVDY